MSYTKPCNKCGQRISLRQMPAGHWLAFDVSTEEPHVCGIKHEPNISVKLKSKNKTKNIEETEDFGIKVDDFNEDFVENDIDEIEEIKNYTNTSGIHNCIDTAIKEKKRIFIEYYSEHNEETTEREISPIKKFKEKGRVYLQAYCHKRKGERVFVTKSISSASPVNKKRTKIKLGRPKVKLIKEAITESKPYEPNNYNSDNNTNLDNQDERINTKKASNDGVEIAKEIGKGIAFMPLAFILNPPVLIIILFFFLPTLLSRCSG